MQEADETAKTLTGSREEQISRCDDISQTIQEIRLGEFAAQKDRDALLAAVAELQARKLHSSGTVQKLREEIEALEAKTHRLEEEIRLQAEKAAHLKAEAEEKRTGAKRTAEKRTSLEQEAGELRVRERETGARRENVGHELARLQERSENLQREYDTIISRLWEEYELTRREAEEIGKKIEDLPAAQKRLNELKNRIKALGAVNVGAVVESVSYTHLLSLQPTMPKNRTGMSLFIQENQGMSHMRAAGCFWRMGPRRFPVVRKFWRNINIVFRQREVPSRSI